MDNKGAIEERVVQTLDRLNVVNDALLKVESDDAELMMLTFSKSVMHACYLPCSELLSGISLMKPLC